MMNAAIVVKSTERITHTAPAARGRLSSSWFVSCNRVLPKPTLMLVSTTETRPVPRPVSMMASQTR